MYYFVEFCLQIPALNLHQGFKLGEQQLTLLLKPLESFGYLDIRAASNCAMAFPG